MRFLPLFLLVLMVGTFALAREKAQIDEGPVKAYSKYNQVTQKKYNDGKLYLQEPIYLLKGDWLNVQAIIPNKRLYILLFDFAEKNTSGFLMTVLLGHPTGVVT